MVLNSTIFVVLHGKMTLLKYLSKNLAENRSKNNFVELSK